jgi:excisionase family DNA binding protein
MPHPTPAKTEEKYFTTKAAGAYLGRSDGAVRNLVLRRAIPFRKPGGRLVFIKSELDGWIDLAPGVRLDEIEGLNRER